MNLHEYQGKDVFRAGGIPVPPGEVARTVEEAETFAARLGFPVVIKAQVLIGGRGKAGGVKVVKNGQDFTREAGRILGMDIKGHAVRKILITPATEIDKEFYAGIVLDRKYETPLLMVSPAGGVDIEDVARQTPEKILRLHLDERGLPAYRARAVFLVVNPLLSNLPFIHTFYNAMNFNFSSCFLFNTKKSIKNSN